MIEGPIPDALYEEMLTLDRIHIHVHLTYILMDDWDKLWYMEDLDMPKYVIDVSIQIGNLEDLTIE